MSREKVLQKYIEVLRDCDFKEAKVREALRLTDLSLKQDFVPKGMTREEKNKQLLECKESFYSTIKLIQEGRNKYKELAKAYNVTDEFALANIIKDLRL